VVTTTSSDVVSRTSLLNFIDIANIRVLARRRLIRVRTISQCIVFSSTAKVDTRRMMLDKMVRRCTRCRSSLGSRRGAIEKQAFGTAAGSKGDCRANGWRTPPAVAAVAAAAVASESEESRETVWRVGLRLQDSIRPVPRFPWCNPAIQVPPRARPWFPEHKQ